MNPNVKKYGGWILTIGGALGGLAILGMAAQFWIQSEVKSQLTSVEIPDTMQVTQDVAVIKSDIANIKSGVDQALESQQRFEEIFTEYLINEANR